MQMAHFHELTPSSKWTLVESALNLISVVFTKMSLASFKSRKGSNRKHDLCVEEKADILMLTRLALPNVRALPQFSRRRKKSLYGDFNADSIESALYAGHPSGNNFHFTFSFYIFCLVYISQLYDILHV